MARTSKSDSTLRTLSRADSDVFTRSPLVFDGGRVVWRSELAATPQVKAVCSKCKDEDCITGVMSALYYITDPRSIYRDTRPAERVNIVLDNHVSSASRKAVQKLIGEPEFKQLQQFLLSLITTPSERLYLTLKNQVSAYADKITSMEITSSAKDGKELMQSIEFAQDSAERIRDLEKLLREEATTVHRAGYEERLFESKDQ